RGKVRKRKSPERKLRAAHKPLRRQEMDARRGQLHRILLQLVLLLLAVLRLGSPLRRMAATRKPPFLRCEREQHLTRRLVHRKAVRRQQQIRQLRTPPTQ
ncbi:hypothetical protein TraAM80_09802, partial [Trypanosoma rangeli]